MDQEAQEQAIAETKEKRSRLKAKLTATTKQISSCSRMNRARLKEELDDIYSNILTMHYQYSELVESDPKFSDYGTVGGLNLNQYLEAIELSYKQAVKSYADSLYQDVSKAIVKANLFLSHFSDEEVDSPYLVEEAESHLAFCKELSVDGSSIHDFNAVDLDRCIFKLGSNIHKYKQSGSARSAQNNSQVSLRPSFSATNGPSHLGLPGGGLARPGASGPPLESTRASLNTQTAGSDLDAPVSNHLSDNMQQSSSSSSGAGAGRAREGINTLDSNLGAPGSSHLLDNMWQPSSDSSSGVRAGVARGDISVVNAYNSGSAMPTFHTQVLTSSSSSDNSVTRRKSKFIKTPLPTFNGDRRVWPEFRSVWRMHAEQEYNNDLERAWALKSCLKDKALDCVKAILVTQPDAYGRMWRRLDNVYCDVSLNIQSVQDELKKLKPVSEGDLVALVNFVNQIELCYSQLGEVGQVNSITMPQVDQLCDLLPI
jgi:hypothetical protein